MYIFNDLREYQMQSSHLLNLDKHEEPTGLLFKVNPYHNYLIAPVITITTESLPPR